MIHFPQEVHFGKNWRPYQKRVLSELDEHLDDDRLHIIAAPGSGKTVLGLEVVCRLNNPTLILAPTLTIRNQWIDRFIHLFLPSAHAVPHWISSDIKRPAFLTVSTYQGLHCAYVGKGIEEEDYLDREEDEDNERTTGQCVSGTHSNRVDIISVLKEKKIRTIVVDEAHHLRSEWWATLIAVRNRLERPIVVALTATPPYDVPQMEWNRYQQFCGPVDAEISVPELVREGNLCPHQDYVYFSLPSQDEAASVREYRSNVEHFMLEIRNNLAFVTALQGHPWVKEPEKHVEEILDAPEFFSSIAIFIHQTSGIIPKSFRQIMGIPSSTIPPFDVHWAEVFMTGLINTNLSGVKVLDDTVKVFKHRISQIGALDRNKVLLRETKEINQIISKSTSKIKSIIDIAKLENESMGRYLRMVILTDYILKSELPANDKDIHPLKRIGVVPIFEALRRENIQDAKIGILSGSFVVIPSVSRDLLNKIIDQNGISRAQIKANALEHDENYFSLELVGQDKHSAVKIVTELFSIGGITILIGTKSLLGEGWDAPTVNTLVLASFVGTYMLSNQMRGRAIRTRPDYPDKTANIWHLVCVEEGAMEPGEDFETLTKRFKSFLGLSFKEKVIESGIERLGIGLPPFLQGEIDAINEEMKGKALERSGLRQAWEEALNRGAEGVHIVEQVKTKGLYLPRGFVFYNTASALFWQGVLWGGFISSVLFDNVRLKNPTLKQYLVFLSIIFAVAAIGALPKCLKALWLFLKHAPVEASMRQIGEALLKALIHCGMIKTDYSRMTIRAESREYGTVYCSLEGASSYDKSVFLNSLQEILGAIENPRYLIARKSTFGILLRKDYYAVPQNMGAKKEYAEYFAKMWNKYVGRMRLVYTRSIEGRKTLLQARSHALSTAFQKRSERHTCWQ